MCLGFMTFVPPKNQNILQNIRLVSSIISQESGIPAATCASEAKLSTPFLLFPFQNVFLVFRFSFSPEPSSAESFHFKPSFTLRPLLEHEFVSPEPSAVSPCASKHGISLRSSCSSRSASGPSAPAIPSNPAMLGRLTVSGWVKLTQHSQPGLRLSPETPLAETTGTMAKRRLTSVLCCFMDIGDQFWKGCSSL